MARNISSASLTKLGTNLGTEPINIIEIQWVPSGPRDAYADRDIVGGIKGRILEIGGLDDVVQVSGGGQSQQISLTLDDTDGSLKAILDTQDIHKRPCWVYQWFEGLATSEKFLIFRGEINSPVEWNEGDRTVKFDVISKIEDVEIGFSIEEGNFPGAPADLIGKPWPLCFGTVVNVPCLKLQSTRQGVLASGVGIADFTLERRIELANDLVCPWVFVGWQGKIEPGGGIGPKFEEDPECKQRVCLEQEKLQLMYDEQKGLELPSIHIFGGDLFPQGVEVTIDINGGKFNGVFNGEVFTITSRRHPDMDTSTGLPIVEDNDRVIASNCGIALPTTQEGGVGGLTDEEREEVKEAVGIFQEQALRAIISRKSWEAYENYPTSSFFWCNGGSKVTLEADHPLVYVANILPSTILRVAAYRELDSGRFLLTVPSEYYTIQQTDYTSYQVMELVFDRSLTSRNEGWEDDIYVTLTSSVGPNTVDILRWLIETYTDHGVDDASFDDIETKIDNYPMNFALLERKNLLNALEEIAFQARCAIYLKDDTFFLKYLSEDPTTDDTITVSDVLAQSLTISHTPTEELVTKYVAEWREDYAKETPNTLILRHNVSKYGTHEQNYDFYCFNILSLVQKSATFWLIRKANTWRKARFKTPVSKLTLETFDTIALTLPAVGSGTIKALVEKANYNSSDHTIDFEVWTPIKSGTTTPYDFAWPASVQETLLFPSLEEREGGFAGAGFTPGFSTIAPVGHPLALQVSGGFTMKLPPEDPCFGSEQFEHEQCRPDYGDKNPSDQGDEKPTVKAAADDTGNVNTGSSPITTGQQTVNPEGDCCEIAKQALAEAKRAQEAAARANGDNTKERDKSDLPDNNCEAGNCEALVRLKWIKVSLIRRPDGSLGDQPGDTGKIVNGDIESLEQCITTNSAVAAQRMRDQLVDETQQISDSYGAEVGKQYVWLTSTASSSLGVDSDPESPNFGNPCSEPDEQLITGFHGDDPASPGMSLPSPLE